MRMTNLSRSVHGAPDYHYRNASDAALPARRSNHDPAGDTQQDTRGNVDEQNQARPIGVRTSRASAIPFLFPPVGDPLGPVLSPRITSFREMWRRGGVPRRYLPPLVSEQFVEPRPPPLRVALLFNHVSSRLVPLLSFQVPSQDVTFFSFN